VKKKSHK